MRLDRNRYLQRIGGIDMLKRWWARRVLIANGFCPKHMCDLIFIGNGKWRCETCAAEAEESTLIRKQQIKAKMARILLSKDGENA
jgi:hypothetical protein